MEMADCVGKEDSALSKRKYSCLPMRIAEMDVGR